MERLSQDFLRLCETRQLTPASIRIYREHLARFVDWLARAHPPGLPPAAITTEVALRYLETRPTWSAAYKRQFLAALRTCLAHGRRLGLPVGHVDVQTVRVDRRLPRVFSRAEVARLFAATARATDALARRDRALLAVLYYGALRAAEVCALDVQAVDLRDRLLLVDGKGKRQRLVPLPPEAMPALAAHLDAHPGGVACFYTRAGARLTRKALVLAIERRADEAGLTGRVHAHAFRHSRSAHLLDAGASLEDVSDLLGHSRLETTMTYRHVSRAKLRRAVELPAALPAA